MPRLSVPLVLPARLDYSQIDGAAFLWKKFGEIFKITSVIIKYRIEVGFLALEKVIIYKNGHRHFYPKKILKLIKIYDRDKKDFYYGINLTIDRKHKTFRIHNLVAQAFIPNPNNLPEVNHKDNNKQNNNDWNLEWSNVRENTSHYYSLQKTTSKYTGVSWHKGKKKWQVQISINNKSVYLGTYDNEEIAHQAYQNALKDYGLQNRYATFS